MFFLFFVFFSEDLLNPTRLGPVFVYGGMNLKPTKPEGVCFVGVRYKAMGQSKRPGRINTTSRDKNNPDPHRVPHACLPEQEKQPFGSSKTTHPVYDSQIDVKRVISLTG